MIKVTKEGKSPDAYAFQGSCKRCGSEFTFEKGDLEIDRDGTYVKCPTKGCGQFITVDIVRQVQLKNLDGSEK